MVMEIFLVLVVIIFTLPHITVNQVIIPFLIITTITTTIILPTIPILIYQMQPQLHLIFGKSLKQKVDMTFVT